MKISEKGLELIKKSEGCRLSAYKDAGGVWTIGYGHTGGVTAGQTISQTKAEEFLKADVNGAEKAVTALGKAFSQNQFDALVSFTFNCGAGNLRTLCGGRDIDTIGEKITLYNKCAGMVLTGLVSRRKAEQALYKTPCGTSASSGNVQAAQAGHVQLNYKAGDTYTVQVDSLLIRTKPSVKGGKVIKGKQTGSLKKGAKVKNLATMRVGEEIWMFIGLDSKKREMWICADNGIKAYTG